MGMFDYIKEKLYCPYCGTLSQEGDYQTKDFGNMMTELELRELRGTDFTIWHKCANCNNWIELSINRDGIHSVEEGKKQIEKRNKELGILFASN